VVTLEPGHHTGLTGPCPRALIDAGVSRVVLGQSDPNPVARGGAAELEEAGIRVVRGVLAHEAEALNPAWTFAFRHGRPRVTWKFAASLDGRSAAADGTSRWITGPEARADVHELRAGCDAILVGTGTVLADDPQLTVRHPDGSLRDRQPLRVVAGRRPVRAGARVLDHAAPTVLFPEHDPALVLKALHEQEIHHVWLEGGPTLAAAFLRAGLVDEVVAYVAPVLLGAGPNAVSDLGIETIGSALRLEPTEVRTIGADLRVRATVAGQPTHHEESR
jgi:diaminohydroxyphosphoribosylaminopyrimidine deaminase/5-amino-6-(5-phosphoribosylamino)uracil reductase